MVLGALTIGVIVGMAIILVGAFANMIPKVVRMVLGLVSFLVVGLFVVDAIGGQQVFGLLAFIQGLPVVGGFLAGVVLGITGATIASSLVG